MVVMVVAGLVILVLMGRMVMIVMLMLMLMLMLMPVLMRMLALVQQPGAGEIDDQAEHGDGNRLVEADRDRRGQAHNGFIADQQRDDGQDDGAGITRQLSQLAGAEGVARIMGVAAGKPVGQRRNCQRSGMGRHVEAIGQQCHRAIDRAGNDLADHHRRGQGDDDPGAARIAVMVFAKKYMIVPQGFERFAVHVGPVQRYLLISRNSANRSRTSCGKASLASTR